MQWTDYGSYSLCVCVLTNATKSMYWLVLFSKITIFSEKSNLRNLKLVVGKFSIEMEKIEKYRKKYAGKFSGKHFF